MEQTLILVKPSAVTRGLVGEVIARFERKGFVLCALKLLQITPQLASEHYAEHRDKPFFNELVEVITDGPVVAMVVGGPQVIALSRKMMGATNPENAEPGSLRGDLATEIVHNVVHGSDSPQSASREIALFFSPDEMVSRP